MTTLVLRCDVDYAYHSRVKSVLSMFGLRRHKWRYLGNAEVIAEAVNKSRRSVVCYWFFTVKTLPSLRLLRMLDNKKHIIGLHVVKDFWCELYILERHLGRQVNFYTVHGTASWVGQLLWGRRLGQVGLVVPDNLRVEAFDKRPTFSLDYACYGECESKVFSDVSGRVKGGVVLALHPEWLFKSNGKDRGPFFDVLKTLLIDGEFTRATVGGKGIEQ